MNELTILKDLVRQLLNDLPTKRDWLDPTLEQGLRAMTTDPNKKPTSARPSWAS